jgi:protein TonB
MKCVPVSLLLFFVTSSTSFTAKGQSPASIKAANVDTSGEEVGIGCGFSEIIEPEFPGGMGAWQSFLRRNLKYPPAAGKAKMQGTVVVAFIVNPDGKVTEIEAVSGPDQLKQAAVDVIKKSPKWTPAVQRGHHVKAIKNSPSFSG